MEIENVEVEIELEVAVDDIADFFEVDVENGIFVLMSVVINSFC